MIDLKWDHRFLQVADVVASWSKDPSTKTGAVIVDADQHIVAVGYNAFPEGMEDRDEWLTNREEKYSRIVHCEINALISAKQNLRGCTLYTVPFLSCDRCCVQMLQAGIVRFVAPKPNEDQLSRWAAAFEKTKKYISECGATYLEVDR